MLTLKRITKEIQKHYPKVELVRGEMYFYLYSEDKETGLKLSSLYSTGIYVNLLSHLTLEQWMQSVDSIMKQENKPYDRH
jgi:hypothetical protein